MMVGILGLGKGNVGVFCLCINFLILPCSQKTKVCTTVQTSTRVIFAISELAWYQISQNTAASRSSQMWGSHTVREILQQQQFLGVSINTASDQVGLQIAIVFTDCPENEMSCVGIPGCSSGNEFIMKN